MRRLVPLTITLLAGCGGASGDSPDLAVVDKAANCAATFGNALTLGFGRVDGTIRAVVPPAHPSCAMPNSDHLVLQVDLAGATYRMVVNVQSDHPDADPAVRMLAVDAPMVGPAFAEGWHVPVGFDYVQSLAVHSPAFQPHGIDELTALISAELEIGAPISVFATTDGGASTHLVHRNAPAEDGAIVTHPTSATPHWLLFAFSTQTF
jgi:hypothetical protein